jgi:amino acid transporter
VTWARFLPETRDERPIQQLTEPVPKTGLWGAISANVLNMVGVGPFLTIPLALAAMGGPQAMLGWILGLIFSLCDGMVWAELGSAMPCEGGPYHYLLQAFGPRSYGRLFSFLFLWQAVILGPISAAGGAVGFAQYAGYLQPNLPHAGTVAIAAAVCLVNTILLCRNIRSIAVLSIGTAVIVLGATAWVIFAGVTHFHANLVFDFPPHAFQLNHGFLVGLGASTLIAMYDYGGYYNACLIGAEISTPKRTIPRSVILSIVLVSAIYLVMNISIIGVIPWREAMHSQTIVTDFMARIYGHTGATCITLLILIASFGSVFAIILGYSRIPYAAAVQGDFFSIFGRLHSKGKYPYVALLTIGIGSALACLFTLENLITALIVTQTLLQFVAQCVAVILLRRQKPKSEEEYKMPLFPLPALVAMSGWLYIIFTSGWNYIALAALFLAIGIAIFLMRARRQESWPFSEAA